MTTTEQSLLDRLDSRLTQEDLERYYGNGQWRRKILADYLQDALQHDHTATAAVSYDVERGTRVALTYEEYADLVARTATGLAEVGIGPGDITAVMLPNRHEFGAVILGLSRLGAIYSGIPITYGSREVEFILNRTKAKVLVVQRTFRGRDFTEFVHELRPRLEHLETVVVVPDGEERGGLQAPYRSWADLTAKAGADFPEVDPGSVCQIGFTSGTTGEPKGVMNTHQNLDAVLHNWIQFIGRKHFGEHPVNLIPSPVGHHSGFLWGVLMSAYLKGTAVFMDRWSPDDATEIVASEQVTTMIAAPTFLQDLLDSPARTPEKTASWKVISIPGAPIPRALVRRATKELGCFICPSWGMTEWGIGVSAAPGLPEEKIYERDGVPVPGCDVRVVNDAGEPVAGEEGDLQIKGAGLFVGYYERPQFTDEAFVGGWFKTGDRAIQDEDGFIEIRGRTKDIIIRGGENIPVVELENVIYRHPDIADVALVGLPDPRLGERACAVVVLRQGADLSKEELSEFLLREGVSKHFLPERFEVLDAMPKTMSGKIRKVELRERYQNQP
jgi:cyclohexanecarboxylate-CoA ligase